jgi:UDP-N-acetylmuramyl pentapeptide phosphotransferase/UDP-N-acetylglucosamine-1-phosphate transferase
MSYIFVGLALSAVMIGYIFLAKKVGIIDKPNERSSHEKPTVRGAGVIFPIAVIIWASTFNHMEWYFVSAVFLIGAVGFLDDYFSISQIPRLIIQSLGVMLVLIEMGFLTIPLFFAGIAFILITGWLNTFNFMDGINGISVLYAGSVLIGVYLFRDTIPDVQLSLIYTVGLSLVVFGWFNVRKNALAFAGDVGSLSMGLILAYFVSSLIISTGRWEFILFISVYGVDSVLTILHRIKNGENIFVAHRSHLYQYLANEMKWSHLIVAFIYSSIQLMVIVGLLFIDKDKWTLYSVSILTILTIMYASSKVYILKRIQKLNL